MIRRALLIAPTLCALYLAFWPVPVDPIAWTPGPAPALAEDARLEGVAVLPLGVGAEDVAVDARGRIYGGDHDGRIWRVAPGGAPEIFAETGGRPLGLAFDARGQLIVCDSTQGLLQVDPSGGVTVLADGHGGRPFGFTDDLDIGPDGTIYFSDASHKFGQSQVTEAMVESRPNGRLLAYDPATGETRLLLDGLHFANGVAVTHDGDAVLVSETTRYRVLRYWLRGPRAGTSEIFADNLPGFPDGVSRGSDGRFWVALFSPRIPTFDALLSRPFWRTVAYRLPAALQPAPAAHGVVLGLDATGRVVETLADRSGAGFAPITSVQEHDGALYLGSLTHAGYGRLPLQTRAAVSLASPR